MSDTFIRVQSAQKAKTRQRTRRTALSLFIGGLFCSAAPAWADCTVSGTPNANGGVDMTCEGIGITQDTNLLGNQSNNTVTVQGDGTTVSSEVYGGSGSGNSGNIIVTGNTVTLNQSSSVGYFVTGGSGLLGDSSYSGNIIVTGNTVTLNQSSSVGYLVSGGDATNLGLGSTVSAGNTVTLNGSSVSNTIMGGNAQSNHGTSTVTGNIVTLNNSSAGNDVYGGYGAGYDNSVVTDNIVNINDTATVPGSLYGGFFSDFNGGVGNNIYDAFSGNTLNFAAAPITLSGEMANFENYNFTVDPALVNTGTALITADTMVIPPKTRCVHK